MVTKTVKKTTKKKATGRKSPSAKSSTAAQTLLSLIPTIKTKIKVDQSSTDRNGQPINFKPHYQVEGSIFCDLMANCQPDINNQRRVVIPPRNSVLVDCGFTIFVPAGFKAVARVKDYARDKGLVETSNVYVGERRVTIRVRNVGRDIFIIEHGD